MVEDAFRTFLRPSEELKIVVETLTSLPAQPGHVSTQNEQQMQLESLSTRRQGIRARRVMAVISHRDDLNGSEEGSVLICKYKPHAHGISPGLEVQRVLPITETFSIAKSTEIKRGERPSDSSADPDPTSCYSFVISPGPNPLDQSRPPTPLTLFTFDAHGVRAAKSQCDKLRKTSSINEETSVSGSLTGFRWLIPYIPSHNPLTFNEFPQDLRSVRRPLHTRLSPFPEDDSTDFTLIRDHWVRTRTREATQKGRRAISIRIGTFNVNGKLPSQDLSTWIGSELKTPTHSTDAYTTIPPLKDASPLSLGEVIQNPFESGETLSDAKSKGSPDEAISPTTLTDLSPAEKVDSDPYPDMLVLGFQELDLSTEALIYSIGTVREDAWCMALFASLGEKAVLYEKLSSKQLVGMLIVILVKKTLRTCFQDIHTSVAAVGIMGIMGNKGGTAVRLTFTPHADPNNPTPGATTFTFVNAHLAAFDEMYDKRNSDFQDLTNRLSFSPVADGPAVPGRIHVYETDVLFWMVDLNYRLDLPDADVRTILSSELWSDRFQTLLRYDQLKKAIRTRDALVGFSEHEITHLPTYRFSPGLPIDGLGYDVKRKPAWTDRILYMNAPHVGLRQHSYTSHPQITMSDHRPVAADFVVEVDFYDKSLREAEARKLYEPHISLDEYSGETQIDLDRTSVDLGRVSYRRTVSQAIRLSNPSKDTPCAYRFIHNLTHGIHPEWLHIEPMVGFIPPQEHIDITLTAYVDTDSASKLNLGPKQLDVTLILHAIYGQDYLIRVTGDYEYTCFANTLSRLTRLPGPIRSLNSPEDLRPLSRPINAPREVMRLVNWMMSDHSNVDGLFVSPADETIVDTIRECLDSGEEFPSSLDRENPDIPLAFGATLLRLLESLTEAVVPAPLHSRCIQATSRDEAFDLLDSFPPSSVNVWITITAFLHYVCQSSANPSEKAERIATIFAPVFLRDDLDSDVPPVSPLGKCDFLMYFIS